MTETASVAIEPSVGKASTRKVRPHQLPCGGRAEIMTKRPKQCSPRQDSLGGTWVFILASTDCECECDHVVGLAGVVAVRGVWCRLLERWWVQPDNGGGSTVNQARPSERVHSPGIIVSWSWAKQEHSETHSLMMRVLLLRLVVFWQCTVTERWSSPFSSSRRLQGWLQVEGGSRVVDTTVPPPSLA